MGLDLGQYEERDPETEEEWQRLAEFLILEAMAMGILDATSASIIREIPSVDRLRTLLHALRSAWKIEERGGSPEERAGELRRMIERALWPKTVEEAVRQIELRLDEGTKKFVREAEGMFLVAAGAIVTERMESAFGISENDSLIEDAWRRMGEPDESGWALQQDVLWFIFREYWARVTGKSRSHLTLGYEMSREEKAGGEQSGASSPDTADLLEEWRRGPVLQPLDVDLLVSWVVVKKEGADLV